MPPPPPPSTKIFISFYIFRRVYWVSLFRPSRTHPFHGPITVSPLSLILYVFLCAPTTLVYRAFDGFRTINTYRRRDFANIKQMSRNVVRRDNQATRCRVTEVNGAGLDNTLFGLTIRSFENND